MFNTEKSAKYPKAALLSGLMLIFVLLASACRPAQTPTPTEPPAAPPTQPPAPTATEAAAAPTPEEVEPVVDMASELVDQLWLLVAYGDPANPTVVEEGTTVTALFAADGNLSGSGGCNNYSTSYELSGDQLTVGPIATTMMACEKGMDQEAAVLAALQKAQRISFSPEGRLEIFYESSGGVEQKLIYAPGETPLVETVWVLQSLGAPANPTSLESGTIITAIFTEEGLLSGSSGCNNYSAGYTVEDSQIEIQQPISTMMACSQGMEQEAAYLEALVGAESYQISGVRLEISYDGGAGVLVYTSRNLTLENTLWTLVMMNGEPNTIGLVSTTALFDPGSEPQKGAVGGVAMCNNYQGSYTVDGDNLAVQDLTSTTIRCPQTVAQAEATYLELLETAQTYQVFGQTLIVTSETGALTFVANRAPLEGTTWRLNTLGAVSNPQMPVAGAEFIAQFVRDPNSPSGLMVGSTGCNDYNAVYVANLNEIKINLPARTNNSGCAPGLNEQEQQYFWALNAATTYRILGDNLQIPYGEGEMLSFTAFVPAPAPPPPSGGPLTVLNGTRWWLISMGNTVILPGSEVTAAFAINADGETGTLSGTAGCNNYNAPILGVFRLGPIASTKMFCANPPGLMEQESAYLAMLATANSFSQAYNQLLIGTSSGLLVYYNSPIPVLPVEPPPTVTAQPPASVTPELTPEIETPEIETPEVETPEIETPEPPEVVTPEPTPEPDTPEPPVDTEAAPAPPVAVITGPTEGDVGQEISFSGSASSAEAGILSYTWDFGDGSVGNGPSVKHAYADPGSYTVSLTVVDSNGEIAATTLKITIT